MESIKKFIGVMVANLGLTIVLFAAIILFAVFSDGHKSVLRCYACA